MSQLGMWGGTFATARVSGVGAIQRLDTSMPCSVCGQKNWRTRPVRGQRAGRGWVSTRCGSCEATRAAERGPQEWRKSPARHARYEQQHSNAIRIRAFQGIIAAWVGLAVRLGAFTKVELVGGHHPTKPFNEQRWTMRAKVALFRARYLEDHPNYKPRTTAALNWSIRYHTDPKFRAAQIARAHRRKTEGLVEDGTLDGTTICRLFSVRECPYCGGQMSSQDKTLDHVRPRSKGGRHSVSNVVVCCTTCNTKKQAMWPHEWLERLDVTDPDRAATVEALWRGIPAA